MKKTLLSFLAIFAVGVGVASAYHFYSGESLKLSEPTAVQQASDDFNAGIATPSAKVVESSITSQTKTEISITAKVTGQTAYDLTKEQVAVEASNFSYGVMVTGINGVYNSDTHFWMFYLNGESATQGADKTILVKGDRVTWKYETFEQ
jgi:hypothetical protein